MKSILIAGGTGFVGRHLISFLAVKGYTLHVLTRKPIVDSPTNTRFFRWDIEKKYIDRKAFEGVDTIINLTGENIAGKRWTKQRKKEIVESRVKPIELLHQYVAENGLKIDTFISSSAVGFYGTTTTNEIFDETSEEGDGFLPAVCRDWEASARRFSDSGVRTVILRKGVIIGKDGGMVKKISPMAKIGINVSLGSGKQFMPWIDIRDLVKIYEFIRSNPQMEGIYNAVASQHITMNEFSKSLLQSFGRKSFLPNPPSFLIRLAFGEMSTMLLAGSRVGNEKLRKAGFQFEYGTIKKSLGS